MILPVCLGVLATIAILITVTGMHDAHALATQTHTGKPTATNHAVGTRGSPGSKTSGSGSLAGLVVAAESTSVRSRLCDDQIPDVRPLGCFENLQHPRCITRALTKAAHS